MPWAIQMKAISIEEPSRLVQTLTGAILGCGGWVLSRGANDSGTVSMLFEFERQACVDIYSVLIAAGLELSQNGHVRFTELCQCTRSNQQDCGAEIASIDLEIQTFPVEMMHGARATASGLTGRSEPAESRWMRLQRKTLLPKTPGPAPGRENDLLIILRNFLQGIDDLLVSPGCRWILHALQEGWVVESILAQGLLHAGDGNLADQIQTDLRQDQGLQRDGRAGLSFHRSGVVRICAGIEKKLDQFDIAVSCRVMERAPPARRGAAIRVGALLDQSLSFFGIVGLDRCHQRSRIGLAAGNGKEEEYKSKQKEELISHLSVESFQSVCRSCCAFSIPGKQCDEILL